ncbi:MAG: Ig-like domain-containing protein [Salinivirgaceae bacterium]
MKTKLLLLFVVFILLAGFAAKAQIPERTGWWKFDNAGDLLRADLGSPLVLIGTQTSVPGPVEGNLATQIGLGSYLTMAHGIAANGGGAGTLVNEYSVQIDFSVPAVGAWHSFIQTDATNTSDADLFTKTNNTIGTGATGYSANAISVDTWYRMVISVKNGEFFNVYLNGELWLNGTLQAIDGRWALADVLLLFADNDGDDAAINCAEVGIWDVALTATQALELGDAATTQFPERKGWWKFDEAVDMLKAEIGSPLVLTGTQTSVAGPVTGNLATQIGLGSYLTMAHGIAANGGGAGALVNEYSVQIDFSVPAVGAWHSFIQTDATNASDADLFTKTNNTIGTGATGYSTNTISVDTWYRMVISVKNGEFFNVYLNGELWLNGTLQSVDGRWALADVLLLFTDNDGDDATINCSEAGIWDVALTAVQAEELGNVLTTPLATRKGWWKFDDAADMGKAVLGEPLVLTGTQTSVQGPAVGNLATQIGLGSYLTMAHGIAANGGGTMVNEYSVQIDFSVPAVGAWHSFIQTDATNTSDADLFTKTNNTIGTGATGYSTNAISANSWYRMVISVKNGEFFNVYLNGELWLNGTLQSVDGRWALTNTLLLFADNDGDDATINCSELAIWDVALTADQAAKLGKASETVLVTEINLYTADLVTTIDVQGGTLQVSATVLPVDATDQTVTWSVTNGTGGASISTEGLLTAIKNGTVTVNATSNDGGNVTGNLDITISNQAIILVSEITVTAAGGATTIEIAGGTLQMSAAVLPVNATDNTFTWSVANGTGEASISIDGLLAAISDGIVTVNATSNDGGNITGSLDITISNQTVLRERVGWWKFDDAADMLKAELGVPLTLTGTHTSVAGPEAGNLATQVPLGSYLSMTHGIAANGGGTMVNEYSVQIDFLVHEVGAWHSFIQTEVANTGDADLFTKTDNTIGTAATGYSANTISANTWYRMVISVKNGEFFNVYLDGELWLNGTLQPLDGRWALADVLLLFADNDGDDATINCAEAAIWDVALSATEVLDLGSLPNAVLVSGVTVTAAGGATTIETSGGTLQMSATVLPVDADDKTVTWSVTNGTGAASISTDGLLTAISDGTVTVNATSNDGGNVTGSLVITMMNQTGISSEAAIELKVYPNPVVNELNVSVSSNNASVTIYNSLGIKMEETHIQGNRATLDVSHYAHGIYYLIVNKGTTIKFVK